MKLRDFDPKLVIGSIVVLGLLLVNTAFTYYNIQKFYTDTGWVIHTHKVIESIDKITSQVTVAGARQREYIITGDPKYLEPFRSIFSSIFEQFRLLESFVKDNPAQLARTRRLKTIIHNRLKVLNAGIFLMEKKGWNAARHSVGTSLEKMTLDGMRDLAEEMIESENNLLQLRTQRFEYVYHVTLFTSLLTNLISFIMVGAFLYVLRLHLIGRAKAENILFEERELFRTTINSIGDAVLTTDIEGRVTSLNAVAQSLMGWTEAEAVGQTMSQVFRIIDERTRKPIENPVSKVLQNGVIARLTHHTLLIAKNGVEIPIDDSAAPLKDKRGNIIGVVLIFRDITESKKFDEDRRQLAAIVDFSEDAIISKDLKGVISTWNQAAEKLFGYTAEEAINKSILMLIPQDRRNEEIEILKRIQQGERIDSYKTVRQRKDGTFIDISLTISPIKDSNNIIIGASKIARDITKQHQLEEALRESEMRFRQLSEELARSNKELEQFAYVASHDLKEPLHTISSYVDLFVRRSADKMSEKEREYMDVIKQAALQGKVLVKELLEFSRIGKAPELESVDLFAIIEKVKSNLNTLINESYAHIECADNLPHLKSTPTEMGQLFQNLIENSIKYRSLESPRIHVSAIPTDNKMWLISVQDNGVGIEAEYKERIFDIFERLHSKTELSGTGIGLAICKKIVENYGGKIWVESKFGKGSVFCFTFPSTNI